jgi:hypothetical protein
MAEQHVRILTLRTCKADVAVGMAQADIDRFVVPDFAAHGSLETEMPDWRVNGKCAMISFMDNKTR